jgi:hypothetical protein
LSGVLERDQPDRGGLALSGVLPELFAEVGHPGRNFSAEASSERKQGGSSCFRLFTDWKFAGAVVYTV